MLRDIKKLEYRTSPEGAEVIDVVFNDNTKTKIDYAGVQAEVELIESQIVALGRRRKVLTDLKEEVEKNRELPEKARLSSVKLEA